jgi:hypothetical protein
MQTADLVCQDLAEELAVTEAALIEALADGTTYRQIALMALARLAEELVRANKLERRLRQAMGFESWHPENDIPEGSTR